MSLLLAKLRDIDHEILAMLKNNSIIAEEIHQLVDTRDQLLQEFILEIKADARLAQHPKTIELMDMTKCIAEFMKAETKKASDDLNRLQYGKRSVQQYQQFK